MPMSDLGASNRLTSPLLEDAAKIFTRDLEQMRQRAEIWTRYHTQGGQELRQRPPRPMRARHPFLDEDTDGVFGFKAPRPGLGL
jgi:hypothetical protein